MGGAGVCLSLLIKKKTKKGKGKEGRRGVGAEHRQFSFWPHDRRGEKGIKKKKKKEKKKGEKKGGTGGQPFAVLGILSF